MKKVALYTRVSTEEQVKYGISLETQKEVLVKYCKENNYDIYKIYTDEGVSASTITKRKALVELLENLDKFDLLLFTKLDRLSRNVLDANTIVQLLDKSNVSFKSILEDDIETETADGRFIFNLKVNLAEREKNKVSERIKDVFNYKFNITKTFTSGSVPFGYKLDGNKRLIADEINSARIKELYDYYISTQNLNKTIQWWNNKNGKIHYTTIKRYLTNTAYIGKYKKYKKEEYVDNYCPAILDVETFNKVQHLLNINLRDWNKKQIQKNETIFNGLLVCSCGQKYVHKRRENRYYYYCRRKYIDCKSSAFVSQKYIERYLLDNVLKDIKELQIKCDKINAESSKQKSNINSLKQKRDRLSSSYIEGIIDKEFYKREFEKINEQIKQCELIKKPKTNYNELEKIINTTFEKLYNTFTYEEKRVFWRGIIESIEVKSDKTLTINYL